MRSFWGLIGLLVLAAAPSPGRCSEASEQKAIGDNVGGLLGAENFAALNALETAYLDPRQRTSSGYRKLSFFYARIRTFRTIRGGDGGGDVTEPLIRRWLAFSPDAPAPVIALAYLFYTRGMTLRGGDFASHVPDESWPLIRADMTAAANVLTTHKRQASRDPAWYNLMGHIMFYLPVSDRQFDAVTREGTTRHPEYASLWFTAANYYMPQWNGSAADMDRIARLAVARTRARDGVELYARIYLYLQLLWFRDTLFTATDADPALMIQSMRAIASKYPSDANFADFAKVACLAGDQAEASRYTGLIKDPDARVALAKHPAICSGPPAPGPSAKVAERVAETPGKSHY